MPTAPDNTLVRSSVIKTDDSGRQQLIQCFARKGERYGGTTGIPRRQNYGYSSLLPPGSQGLTSSMDGNPDKATITTPEHPDFRWKNLEKVGNIVEYDKWQHRRLKEETQWTDMVGTATVLYKEAGGIVHINPPSTIMATFQAHRDGSRMTEAELADLQFQEAEAERAQQKVAAEAQQYRVNILERLDLLEERVKQLEEEVAAYRASR